MRATRPGIAGWVGILVLAGMVLACVGTLPWTLGTTSVAGLDGRSREVARYNAGTPGESRLPPSWINPTPDQARQLSALVPAERVAEIARSHGLTEAQARAAADGPVLAALRAHWPRYALGTDVLGNSLLVRAFVGGGISLTIGIAAALLSVTIGTVYGMVAGYAGGRVDDLMMRVVDVLYGLPYILLVVLLAVASGALIDEYDTRGRERLRWTERTLAAIPSADRSARVEALDPPARAALERFAAEARTPLVPGVTLDRAAASLALAAVPPRNLTAGTRMTLDLLVLLVAIGGVSWLTMARVVRGQVMSLKAQAFVEAARALGVSTPRLFRRHLLPNLMGTIIVYATLTVPQAILQESFLSFLGIGVKPPLPSWGNLAAEGLDELNPYRSHWWLLVFPCAALGATLLSLNLVGEWLREAMDPKRALAPRGPQPVEP